MKIAKLNKNYILTQIKEDGTVEILPEEVDEKGIILDAVTEDGDYI